MFLQSDPDQGKVATEDECKGICIYHMQDSHELLIQIENAIQV